MTSTLAYYYKGIQPINFLSNIRIVLLLKCSQDNLVLNLFQFKKKSLLLTKVSVALKKTKSNFFTKFLSLDWGNSVREQK